MSGSSYIGIPGSTAYAYFYIYLSGNLSMSGTSYMANYNLYNYIYFNNTSSTTASPQTITYSSTSTANTYNDFYVNSGCVVQLNSNFAMLGSSSLSAGSYGLFNVSGTLICQTYSITDLSLIHI